MSAIAGEKQLVEYADIILANDAVRFREYIEEKATVDLSFPPYYIPVAGDSPADLVQLCASFGRPDLLRILWFRLVITPADRKKGAKMSHLDLGNDMTPLMCAAACGMLGSLKFLADEAKVDLFVRNGARLSALQIAQKMGQVDASEYLGLRMGEKLVFDAHKDIVYLRMVGQPLFAGIPLNIFKMVVKHL